LLSYDDEQVGFSGDVKGADWATLSFQPYFSATAANVGFGYWSHDIVGAGGAADTEMYVRWVQWGSYSGVLRMHDRGESAGPCADDANSWCMLDKVRRVAMFVVSVVVVQALVTVVVVTVVVAID
jgi:alpha-glucosidase (family GH31 glycosyl hydrolase)